MESTVLVPGRKPPVTLRDAHTPSPSCRRQNTIPKNGRPPWTRCCSLQNRIGVMRALHRNEPAASVPRRERLKSCNLVRRKSRRRAENISDGFSTGMTRSPRPIWSLALNRGLTVRTAPDLPMIATVAQGPFHGSGQLSFIRDLSNPEARS